eukprot:4000880-Amphidinium_carterae.3
MEASKALLPACGIESDTGKKPDHVAISLEFRLDLVSQGYRGQKSYETAERQRARQEHLASWSTALAARDVDTIWELWCRAAEKAYRRTVEDDFCLETSNYWKKSQMKPFSFLCNG